MPSREHGLFPPAALSRASGRMLELRVLSLLEKPHLGRVAELADAQDLKSCGGYPPCGFESRLGYFADSINGHHIASGGICGPFTLTLHLAVAFCMHLLCQLLRRLGKVLILYLKLAHFLMPTRQLVKSINETLDATASILLVRELQIARQLPDSFFQGRDKIGVHPRHRGRAVLEPFGHNNLDGGLARSGISRTNRRISNKEFRMMKDHAVTYCLVKSQNED